MHIQGWLFGAVLVPVLTLSAYAGTYTVTSAADKLDDATDEPVHTLRWAIAQANADPGSTIEFAVDTVSAEDPIVIRPQTTPAQLEGGACSPSSAYRIHTFFITATVTIDGYSQNRYRGASEDLPLVEIDGIDVADKNGSRACVNGIFVRRADDVTIRGLAVTRFGRHGIIVDGSANVHIVGNLLGVGYLDGALAPKGNGRTGVLLEYSFPLKSLGGVIEDNVVSANGLLGGSPGIDLDPGADSVTVQNNLVGTDVNGVAAPGYGNSIGIFALSPNHTIKDNTAAANVFAGIRTAVASPIVTDPLAMATNVTIDDNTVIGNGSCGIVTSPGSSATITRNKVHGGTGPNKNDYAGICLQSSNNVVEENEIIGNGQARPEYPGFGSSGIFVVKLLSPNAYPDNSNGNRISRNTIVGNRGLGIEIIRAAQAPPTPQYYSVSDGPNPDVSNEPDAQTIANHQQNRPVLTNVVREGSHVRVSGTLASASAASFEVELFAGAPGTDQAETYLATVPLTTDAAGNASFEVKVKVRLAAGTAVTATATNVSTNDTSEISASVAVTCHGNSCT